MVEFGRAWHIQQVLADAAREGARRAAIHSDPPATEQDIVDAIGMRLANAGIDPTEVETIDLAGWDAGRYEPVTVFIEVPHQFGFFAPLVKLATGETHIMLSTRFTMRNE
jgi:hypothetical protein